MPTDFLLIGLWLIATLVMVGVGGLCFLLSMGRQVKPDRHRSLASWGWWFTGAGAAMLAALFVAG
ncbi:MAG TPA: hypothetical protein VNK70_01505 [Candidatus Paceibacterota bacterium]|nr:hypothetical protein [Candidatus Paceibacterota bacterium]